MFLDYTYFESELYIPNLKYNSGSGVGSMVQAVNEQSLDWYIEKYEKRYLNELLGENLYLKMIDGINRQEDNEWSRLKDRIFQETDYGKYSPAADYVYFYAVREMQTQTSSKGEVRGRQDHASVVSVYDKLVRVWNDMVDMSQDIREYIRLNENLYGKVDQGKRWEYINTFGL